jgi:isopenicillin N synthase-like dioxygenase
MAHSAARTIDVDAIPVIDIARLASGDAGDTKAVATEMLAAAEATGFFYVAGHGVPAELVDAVFKVSKAFFTAPQADKQRVTVNQWHRGFIQTGEAKMYPGSRPDLKESFIWGLDNTTDQTEPDAFGIPPNQWPDSLPGMRPLLVEYFTAVNQVGWRLLRAFAASLDIDPARFTSQITRPTSRGSIIYYPPQPPGAADDQFGVAPHTDWGCLTLLTQDQTGGLEVRGRNAEWVSAVPIPGTYVVNVGDLLARWTNDRFRSTPHRVVNRSGHERLSCAVFVDPDRDTPIEPVTSAGEAPNYAPVTCGDYVQSRFDAAFAYRQKATSAS